MARPSLSFGLTILLRIVFVLAILAAIMAGVLKLLERAGDPLRQGIERYIADTTQSHAYLGALPDPKIFPHVRMTMENIVLSDKGDATRKIATVESLAFSAPFLNTIIGRPDFESLAVKNIVIEKDVLFPRALRIAEGSIQREDDRPVFRMTGDLGGTAVALSLDLAQKGDHPPRYILPPGGRVTYDQGSAHVEGVLQPGPDGLMLQGAILRAEGGQSYGPKDFFLLKNQVFVKDNPVSCLMGLDRDLTLTDTHPCAMLFDGNDKKEEHAK